MKAKLLIFTVLALVFSASVAQGQRKVKPPQVRAETIELGASLLDTDTEDSAISFAELRDPFQRWSDVVTPSIPDQTPDAAPKRIAPRRIPDRLVLQSVARQLAPKGVLSRGNEAVLLLANGRLTVGQTFAASFGDQRYPITVTAISDETFTIRLNATEFTREINPSQSRGHVQIDTP